MTDSAMRIGHGGLIVEEPDDACCSGSTRDYL